MGEAILSHKNWRRQPRTVSLCGVGRATYDVAELGFRSSRRTCVWAGQSQHTTTLAGSELVIESGTRVTYLSSPSGRF